MPANVARVHYPARLLAAMAKNIEVKARNADLDAVLARVAAMRCHGEHELLQVDTFFQVRHGRLKLREFGDGTAELIYYERPNQPHAKLSDYDRMTCADPPVMRHALSTALGVRGVVRKRRRVFLIGNARIHLDEVDGLGSFVELEVVMQPGETVASAERVAAELLRSLGIADSELVSEAYIDLLERGASG
jgi:predicted adenylyl cyclase CyaB